MKCHALLARSACTVRLAMFLGALAAAGCTIEAAIDDLAVTQGDVAAAADSNRGAPRGASGNATITDGASNTINVGENPPPADNLGSPRPPAPPPPGSPPPTPDAGSSPAPPAAGASPDAAQQAQERAEITALLGDKQFEFGDSSFFSSGSITENNVLVLCAFGRFGMQVTRITTTSFGGDLSSETTLFGTWTVEFADRAPLLVLNVDDAADPADRGPRRISLASNAAGNLLLDSAVASIRDAAATCAAAQGGQ